MHFFASSSLDVGVVAFSVRQAVLGDLRYCISGEPCQVSGGACFLGVELVFRDRRLSSGIGACPPG